jgi:hypothetical protein
LREPAWTSYWVSSQVRADLKAHHPEVTRKVLRFPTGAT